MLGEPGCVPVADDAALPPPPRSGLAIRPKFNGEDVAAFCAAPDKCLSPKIAVKHNHSTYPAPGRAAPSPPAAEPRTSGSALPTDGRHLAGAPRGSVSARSGRAACAPRSPLLSSVPSSGRRASKLHWTRISESGIARARGPPTSNDQTLPASGRW